MLFIAVFSSPRANVWAQQQQQQPPSASAEYLWYEAENMRGLTTDARGEQVANPSWADLPRAKAPGWGINGPGVSAEWTQGGESEWNSVAASADEGRATIYQDVVIPRAGDYRLWVRYGDWGARTETFTARITQNGREVARHEFGGRDVVDPHDETILYWGWAFTWDLSETVTLGKGAARISIEIERAADERRVVDCFVLTNDLSYQPDGRRKPDFAAARYLREWMSARPAIAPLITPEEAMREKSADNASRIPAAWRLPSPNGRDFMMPWNIAREFWALYDRPPAERPLYPFNAEPLDEFIKKYSGAKDAPLFASRLVVPVIYINDLPTYLKEGSPFLRYLRETHVPFAVLINYGAAQMSEADGQAAWKLLTGELREQFIGWISGESIGHVWGDVAQQLKINSAMPRERLLAAYHDAYTGALTRKWSTLFHTATGPMWDKLIPAQSTSSTSYAHALGEWGVRTLGIETSAVQPAIGMRLAFTRGAARQYGASVFYYHAPNFGDTATAFTKQQNFAGPDNFFHSRYGVTMGPSLSWYRKSYYLYFMGGASAIYLEQGFDQFFKPGPGEHDYQLNPFGRITDEFMRFAEKHAADRGTPDTPIAFLLDPAHGWEMTDFPQLPFGVSPVDKSDRALRELFGAAYYPALVDEGEPATAERQSLVNAVFGDIYDVLVASDTHGAAIDNYRALIVGGRPRRWSSAWAARLARYVERGGTIVINAAQVDGLSDEFLGVRRTGAMAEAEAARCLEPNEATSDLRGQVFRYERVNTIGAATRTLIAAAIGDDPLVTVRTVGKGRVIFCALPDLLGMDERLTPFAAHMLAHLAANASPVAIRGDVEYLVNRTARGYVVTLFNNRGVTKQQQGMAQVDRRAVASVALDLRGKAIAAARDWMNDALLDVKRGAGASNDTVAVKIPAGGIAIIELTMK